MICLKPYFNAVLNSLTEREERPFLRNVIEYAEKYPFIIVEAPTGYGKSVISQTVALYSLVNGLKSIIAFPLRVLLEDQLSKFRKLLSKLSIRGDLIGARYMGYAESKYLIKPITLTTVDTLSMTLFGIPPEDIEKAFKYWDGTSTRSLGHYLFSRTSVLLSDVVLDEVHLLADSTKSLNFLMALMRIIASHGQRLIFMSATIPKQLEKVIEENTSDLNVRFVKFSENPDEHFISQRKNKKYDITLEKMKEGKLDKILEWLRDNIKEFRKAIVVFNTVEDAIRFYSKCKNELDFPKDRIILLHSRFTKNDRENKIKLLEKVTKNKPATDEYVIISTQVIEAGIDLSSNLFITEIAPANSLIQRLGRFLRYKEENGRVLIWYEPLSENEEYYKGVYKTDFIRKTVDFLESKGCMNIHIPSEYEQLLNEVYGEDSFIVKQKEVRDLTLIPYILETPEKAIEKFVELEGSFIREDLIVPSFPSSIWREDLTLEKIEDFIIPINFSMIKKICPREEIVISEKDQKMVVEKRQINFSINNSIRILRHVMSSDFVAFIVEGEYSDELGLEVRWSG
jgi:CRISPR-associated endonuclease/helicase Cas3